MIKPMKAVSNTLSTPVEINGDTPTLRLFSLLEVIASKDQYFSLQTLAEETHLPKPTLHRMLQQLESAGLLVRSGDGRHYGTGVRLRRLAENLLLNDATHGARHAVLRNMKHRDPNLEVERAITSLSGLAMGIERIDVAGLDADRVEAWATELKRQVTVINRFIRSMSHDFSK